MNEGVAELGVYITGVLQHSRFIRPSVRKINLS